MNAMRAAIWILAGACVALFSFVLYANFGGTERTEAPPVIGLDRPMEPTAAAPEPVSAPVESAPAADSAFLRTTTLPPIPQGPTAGPPSAPSGTAPSLLIPVVGVQPADLVDTYTAARSSGRSHDAIDIIAPRGTPVVAVAPGSVMKLFLSEQGGITLYQLASDSTTVYYYAHLDRYAPGIVEGMLLERGDTLGFVGDTGNSGAGNYHLHFEVGTTDDPEQYWGTAPRNPYPLLVR